MFEKFTDSARKIVALAHKDAEIFRHDTIRPEHLLLGITREGTGVAATALNKSGITFEGIQVSSATGSPCLKRSFALGCGKRPITTRLVGLRRPGATEMSLSQLATSRATSEMLPLASWANILTSLVCSGNGACAGG